MEDSEGVVSSDDSLGKINWRAGLGRRMTVAFLPWVEVDPWYGGRVTGHQRVAAHCNLHYDD